MHTDRAELLGPAHVRIERDDVQVAREHAFFLKYFVLDVELVQILVLNGLFSNNAAALRNNAVAVVAGRQILLGACAYFRVVFDDHWNSGCRLALQNVVRIPLLGILLLSVL